MSPAVPWEWPFRRPFAAYRQAVSDATDLYPVLGDPNSGVTEPPIGVKTKWVWK